MGLDLIKYRKIGYYDPDYFCGILPKIYKPKYEHNVRHVSVNKEPVKG